MVSVSDSIPAVNIGSRLRYIAIGLLGLVVFFHSAGVGAVEQSAARWLQIKQQLFGDMDVQDGADIVGLDAPTRALDAAVVPIDIEARFDQTPDRYISKLYLIIDNNPSPVAAVFEFPGDRPWGNISTRVRVNAYTDVRTLAELNDGQVYMTSKFVKASGGCSAPALKDPAAAASQLGRMKLVVPEAGGGNPLLAKLLIKHPNSSGLQFDQITRNYIPAHYVRQIEVSYKDAPLFKVATDISISEDPAIAFSFVPDGDGAIDVRVTDSEGKNFSERFDVTPSPEG